MTMAEENRKLRLQHDIPDRIYDALNRAFVDSHFNDFGQFMEHVLSDGFNSIEVNYDASAMLSRRIEELKFLQYKRKERIDVQINISHGDRANKLKHLIRREYGRKGRIYREAIYRYLENNGYIEANGNLIEVM